MERFQIPPSRIAAIPLAAASHFRPSQLHPGQTVQVERPYFLFVGTLEPRKNIEMLISAWREVSRLHKVDLILAGRRRHDCPTVAPQPGLHLLEEIADEALPALYSGAVAFLYPSQYEGFGLPVLEAMQCGAAAIVSKDAALREVSDGVAIELDCWDAKAWIEAMVTVLTRADVAAELRNRSLRRAKEFSWSRTARATREVYAEAIRRLG
jgi:alpha-1,3-rhamnosyl/mannosyltransferase